MNIALEKKDELNAVLRLKIEKQDYETRVENLLKDYRRKAKFDGFRPGMVPMGMVKKMYGKHILLEELNKIVSESLSKYIVDEKIQLLGDPIPSKEEQQTLDLDTQTEFDFAFDLGLSPEIELAIDKKLKLPYYNLIVEDKVIEDQISRYQTRFSTSAEINEVVEKGMIKGNIVQLDASGNVFEGGIEKENISLSASVIRDEEIKKLFIGAKVDDIIDFSIKKAFPNDTEISSMLSISKEEAAALDSNFRLTIKNITEFVPHELNQELIDKVYGEGAVTGVDEFKTKIKNEIAEYYIKESDYKFLIDTKQTLLDKVQCKFPEEFLKRWLIMTQKELTAERVENEFALFEKDLKWQLIKDKIAKDGEIKIIEENLLNAAKEAILLQFRQYGLSTIPEEQLTNYAKEQLKKEDYRRQMFERSLEDLILAYLKTKASLTIKEITPEDFNKMFEKEHDHDHDHDHDHEHEEEK